MGLGFGSVYRMCGGGESGREGKKRRRRMWGSAEMQRYTQDVAGLLGLA